MPAIISTTRQLTSSPTSISELNFRSENIVIDSVPVTGKIDLIVTDEAAKTITVYDYKTTAYDSKKTWKNNSTLWKYAKQLGFYKLLLENSPKYAKYKVISAQILHTEPDAYGALTARTYDYPPADEAELKSLIQTVYKHITELNFPDIPPDADRKLKNIQEFIATL